MKDQNLYISTELLQSSLNIDYYMFAKVSYKLSTTEAENNFQYKKK